MKAVEKATSYSILRAEFQDKSVKGKSRAPVNFTVSLDIGGELYMLTSSGYTLGIPDNSLDALKKMLEGYYKITSWEVISGKNQAKKSVDFDVETALTITSDLTGQTLNLFIEGDSREELKSLKVAEVNYGDD